MIPVQYNSRTEHHRLPLNFQYANVPDSSLPSDNRMVFDGLPQDTPGQNFMTSTSSMPNILSNNYGLFNEMSVTWDQSQQNFGNFSNFRYPSVLSSSEPNDRMLRGENIPRSMPPFCPGYLGSNNDNPTEAHDPSDYLIDSRRAGGHASSMPYPDLGDFGDWENSMRSPKTESDPLPHDMIDLSPPFRLPSTETSDDGGMCSSREMTVVDGDEPGADEPYAKLIYRALMSTPTHSMVLQQIYQWFRENTVKGSSDSKGWMNSIRHNLSMNAVSSLDGRLHFTSLTISRLSRRLSARFLVTRPRNPRNGFWKSSLSRTVFSLQRDTVRVPTTKSTSKPITQQHHGKLLVGKVG